MSRIPPLNPPYPPEIQAHFDQIMPPGADPLLLFRTLAVSERAWRKFRAGSLLDRGPLSLREREIVITRTCALTKCEYEWGVHIAAFARAARLTPTEITATVQGSGAWPPAEAALIEAVQALHHRARLNDAEFAALGAHYNAAQILEIMLLAGFYRTVAYLVGGLGLALEPDAARFPC